MKFVAEKDLSDSASAEDTAKAWTALWKAERAAGSKDAKTKDELREPR